MKTALACAVIFLALPALAHDSSPGHLHERVFDRASELVPWCKEEAEAHYVGRGQVPYQWSASYHDRGNVLFVDGTLRIEGKSVAVSCRIARGAREQYATIEFDEE